MTKYIRNQSLRKPIALILWLLAGVSFFGSLTLPGNLVTPSFAQTPPPETRSPTVTATIPDHLPPSTPILIEPENNALLNTATPTFVWQGSSDNVAVSHYIIYLDGQIWFNNLPVGGGNTSNYTLTHNSVTNYYSLTPSSLLNNGSYTWKIIAVDTSGNVAESVTWAFTIDTRAPSFVIDTLGEVNVGISVRDPDTFPSAPVRLNQNEPLLTGTGEAGSRVNVTITTPDRTENATFSIGSDGRWQLQLGTLPRDVVIYLDFVIEDAAGNISILLDVPFIIESGVGPPVSPTLPVPTTPGVPPPATPPIAPPATPLIPATAREFRTRFIEAFEGFLPLSLQEVTRDKLLQIPGEEQAPLYARWLNFGAAISLLLPALVSFGLLLVKFGQHASLSMLPLLAALAGLIPRQKNYHGLVFQAETGEDVNYARVVFSGLNAEGKRVYLQTITNAEGFFEPPDLPPGNYVCGVIHPCFSFPSALPRPGQLLPRDFYRGEQFSIAEAAAQATYHHQLCIPVDLESHARSPLSFKILEKLRFGGLISWLSFAFATFITILFPSVWNFLALGLFIAAVFVALIQRSFQPTGLLMSKDGMLLQNAVLRFMDDQTGETLALAKTGENGRYKYPKFMTFSVDKAVDKAAAAKHLALIKVGWQLASADSPDTLIAVKS